MSPSDKFNCSFPESFWPAKNPSQYRELCIKGYETAERSSIIICGLARDLEHFPITRAIIEKIGSLFKSYQVVIYENDSENNTLEWLQNWSKLNTKVTILTEKLHWDKNEQDHSLQRRKRMAYARNQYLTQIKDLDSDYVIVIDTDIFGVSYEGIVNSIGYNLDAVGSNSLLYRKSDRGMQRLYYDSYAYRGIGEDYQEDSNLLRFDRGEDPIEVDSVGGGLILYKKHVLNGVKYTYSDCDHVTLHRQIKANGYKVWLNPSMLTLYTPHYYQY